MSCIHCTVPIIFGRRVGHFRMIIRRFFFNVWHVGCSLQSAMFVKGRGDDVGSQNFPLRLKIVRMQKKILVVLYVLYGSWLAWCWIHEGPRGLGQFDFGNFLKKLSAKYRQAIFDNLVVRYINCGFSRFQTMCSTFAIFCSVIRWLREFALVKKRTEKISSHFQRKPM